MDQEQHGQRLLPAFGGAAPLAVHGEGNGALLRRVVARPERLLALGSLGGQAGRSDGAVKPSPAAAKSVRRVGL